MLLNESEIQAVLAKVQTAFPYLTDWEWNNEKNSEYFGFSVWGKWVLEPTDFMSPQYFVTLDTYENKWRGILTIGQPSYLWSSADVGDAHLLSTDDLNTPEAAITQLKQKIRHFCEAFSALNV